MKKSITAVMKTSVFSAALAAICLIYGCGKTPEFPWQGYIDADIIYVSPESGGIMTELFVSRGDTVKKGDRLFIVDPSEYQAEYSKAEAELKKAQSELDDMLKGERPEELAARKADIEMLKAIYNLSGLEYKRYKKLYDKDATSGKTYDSAKWTFEKDTWSMNEAEANLKVAMLPSRTDRVNAARAALNASEYSLAAAKWKLEQRSVSAKNDARVYDVLLRPGEYAAPGNAALSLIAPENVKIRFFVKYAEAFRLKAGDRIEFSTETPQNRYSAVVDYISLKPEYTPPVIYSQENTEKLMFMIEAKPDLKDAAILNPGLPVTVKIIGTEK